MLIIIKNFWNILLIALMGLFIFILFFHINQIPFASSDESRHGVSALEMIYNHNYIINSWAGQPDMWNLKPILSFLPTCLMILLFGKSILAIRLFSLLCAIFLCNLVCNYTIKKYNIYTAILFISLLFTTSLLIRNHAFRSGDIDSFFILCQITATLSLATKYDHFHITLAAFFSSLAFLAKSWHALFLGLPFLISYGYLIKSHRFNIKAILYPVICFSLPILIWLGIRYQYDGFAFIKEMVRYDLIKRSSHMIENHIHGWNYFIKILFNNFGLIFLTFIFSIFYSYKYRKKHFLTYDIIIYLSAILSSLLIYSIAKTKLYHYGYTHIILICLVTSILIGRDINKYTRYFIIILSFIAVIFAFTNLHKISSIHLPDYYYQLQKNAYPKYNTLYVPQHIEQNERLAIMVFGNFNYDKIKYGKPISKALVFYRDQGNDNSDINRCHPVTEKVTELKNKHDQNEISLFSCKNL